jgi:hypothetical protein
MIIERVLEEATPYLEGIKIKDAVIGISLIGLELSNNHIGVSYVLRENLKSGCSIFPYAQDIIDKDSLEIAEWALTGQDDLQRSIGVAVLTAASRSLPLVDTDTSIHPFSVEVTPEDNVCSIGYIPQVANMFNGRVKNVFIFDRGVSQKGGIFGKVLPEEEQKDILPKCEIIFLSGTTVINHSLEYLLSLCKNAREIVLIGASTPMFPNAFVRMGVTILAGSWWDEAKKDKIFRIISLAGGISHISKFAIKKNVRV